MIHPADEMFDPHRPDHYFEVGWSGLASIETGLADAGVVQVRRILDVPCGHGRVLRMLRGRWPEASITACDLSREAVDFCVASFDAHGVYSANPIEKVDCASDHDLVWVGSLLTHLDAARWPEMLGWMRDRLRPGGALVVTTHGVGALAKIDQGWDYGLARVDLDRALQSYAATGFGYGPYPGDPGYGVSFSSPGWVKEAVTVVDGLELVSHHERAWDDHHDVVSLRRV